VLAAAVASMGFLVAPEAEGAATENIAVTVTIQKLSVSLSAAVVAFGTQAAGATVQTTEANDIVVTNNGNVLEDFSLLLVNPGGWTAAGAAGAETYVLSGLFVGSLDAPGAADFNAEDVITTAKQTATATIFGFATGTADGVDVAVSGTADLWLEFKAPTTTAITTEQSITVTVGAETS
jgi:hypothetical protein